MITTFEEYYSHLSLINDTNKPQLAILIPKNEKIYQINLEERTVETPPALGVKKDHYAETIYFSVDRYYDNMDLASTTCLIQYINEGVKKDTGVEDQGHFYLVPFYDITTLKDQNKILLPWMVGESVTAAAGNVKFSFRFFQLNAENEYIYNLNTKEATSKILNNMDITNKDNENLNIPTDTVSQIYSKINELSNQVGTYWIEI